MSERPTPETDAFAIKLKTTCGEKHWVPVDLSRCLERERDEAREELSKLTGTHLSVALSERNDALNQIQGWENKWKAAVEMAAIAEIKCSDLKEEIANLQDQRDLAMKVIKRLEANQP